MSLRTLVTIVASLALTGLVACTEAPTPGEPTDFASVCGRSNDGRRIAVAGYLQLPDSIDVVSSGDGSRKQAEHVTVRLFSSDQFAGTSIGVDLDVGTGPNTLADIPGEYIFTDSDLKVHLADGETSTYGQRVNVSGKVYFPSSSDAADLSCDLANPLMQVG
jgi:hypothetical protein